ncbi:MAG: hypothetical protein ACN6OV_08490 [Acinetobacter sp.]|uniref:hypothetical protein n=1 Tax=Acinetobacter sp. TaxID=472 RepID=UPI003D000D86
MSQKTKTPMTWGQKVATGAIVLGSTMAVAHAEDAVNIDFSAEVAGVTIIAGLLAIASVKAVPLFAKWGINKALSMIGR